LNQFKYPIVKYPKNIDRKLKARSDSKPMFVEEVSDDLLADLLPLKESKPLSLVPYHWYALGAFCFIWATTTRLSWLNLIPVGMFAASIPLFIASLIGCYQLGRRYDRVKHRNSRAILEKKYTLPREHGSQPTKVSSIDWSEDAALLVRSTTKSSAQVGVSEEFFLKHLGKLLPGKICFGHVYLPEGYSHPYSADIELVLSNGLGIQIEIDEPYVGKTREPHHCWDNKKDTTRDAYFLSIGWIIIRFSERQVVSDPKGCCGRIAEIIVELTDDRSLSSLVQKGRKLELDPQWSSHDSSVWEKNKYREGYLEKAGLWNSRK
jgi:hypothetical protein